MQVLGMTSKLRQEGTSTVTRGMQAGGEWGGLGGLFGAPEGGALRRVTYDACRYFTRTQPSVHFLRVYTLPCVGDQEVKGSSSNTDEATTTPA
eukprot:1190914-Prorocentrum_minimum.AAC.3